MAPIKGPHGIQNEPPQNEDPYGAAELERLRAKAEELRAKAELWRTLNEILNLVKEPLVESLTTAIKDRAPSKH